MLEPTHTQQIFDLLDTNNPWIFLTGLRPCAWNILCWHVFLNLLYHVDVHGNNLHLSLQKHCLGSGRIYLLGEISFDCIWYLPPWKFAHVIFFLSILPQSFEVHSFGWTSAKENNMRTLPLHKETILLQSQSHWWRCSPEQKPSFQIKPLRTSSMCNSAATTTGHMPICVTWFSQGHTIETFSPLDAVHRQPTYGLWSSRHLLWTTSCTSW